MQNNNWQVADAFEYDVLKANARVNRNNQTEAESAFWTIAKANGLGEKCRRQYIIGQYIVDFFFRKSMLIVEIDGGYHRPDTQQRPSKSSMNGDFSRSLRESPIGVEKPLTGNMLVDIANSRPLRESWRGAKQIEYDTIRQDWLEKSGYTILRFTNEEILFDTNNVINKIKQYLKASH